MNNGRIINNRIINNRIIIGSDYDGLSSKEILTYYLQNKGYDVEDVLEDIVKVEIEDYKYTDIANLLSVDIEMGVHTVGILICKTGQGMAIAANKHEKVRAGVAWNELIASSLRKHNNANVLCLPAIESMRDYSLIRHGIMDDIIGVSDTLQDQYCEIVDAFLTTQ